MSLFELLFLMMRLPFAAVAYGIDAFGRVLGDVQEIAEGGRGFLEDEEHGLIEMGFPEMLFPEMGWGEPLPLLPESSSFFDNGLLQEPTKEDRKMDQDLSGNMVKVVQYSIISVVTGPAGGAFVLSAPPSRRHHDHCHDEHENDHEHKHDHEHRHPCRPGLAEVNVVAFDDDMTGEDFTSWMMSSHCEDIDYAMSHLPRRVPVIDPGLRSRKFLRVAFSVIGRFAPADINYTELQAGAVASIANAAHLMTETVSRLDKEKPRDPKAVVNTHEYKKVK